MSIDSEERPVGEDVHVLVNDLKDQCRHGIVDSRVITMLDYYSIITMLDLC